MISRVLHILIMTCNCQIVSVWQENNTNYLQIREPSTTCPDLPFSSLNRVSLYNCSKHCFCWNLMDSKWYFFLHLSTISRSKDLLHCLEQPHSISNSLSMLSRLRALVLRLELHPCSTKRSNLLQVFCTTWHKHQFYYKMYG